MESTRLPRDVSRGAPASLMSGYETLSPFELERHLRALAQRSPAGRVLDAGKGQPNWVAITPREAFHALGRFALAEARRGSDHGTGGTHADAAGAAQRLQACPDAPGMQFVREAVAHGVDRLGFEPDAWVHELVSAALGDFYPSPDRMLTHCEAVVHEFFVQAMCAGASPPGRFDLFATEGGAAAMGYCFTTLRENRLLRAGDRIAIGAPIFTPYLEIPGLDDFELVPEYVRADPAADWQYPDAEIDKLRDPAIKAFFLVNPGNPDTRALGPATLERLRAIVAQRPELIILTDDVYGTFVEDFHSLAAALPANTICVYSFSKHFGATGQRLAVVALHEDNVLDRMLRAQDGEDRQAVAARYASVTSDLDSFKLIDRMVAESRSVALYHIAGLSTPQQALMALFALYHLLDDGREYFRATRALLRSRLVLLLEPLGRELDSDPTDTHYYSLIDMLDLVRERHGDAAAQHLAATDPLRAPLALARDHGIITLPGRGFAGPTWDIRISLANLDSPAYSEIGHAIRDTAERLANS